MMPPTRLESPPVPHVRRPVSSAGLVRWLKGSLVGAVCLVGTLALPALASEAYRLGPGDQLHIAVIGERDLTGDFIIDGSGEVPVPLLGNLRVAGLTVEESRERIAKGLAAGYLQQPNVVVRISRTRPIHVLGEVRNPGSYPYEFNSFVKTAIAQAGGFGPHEQRAAALAEFMAADERVKVLGGSRDRLAIRKARLDAQLKLEDTFQTPSGLALSADAIQQIVADEHQTLQVSLTELSKQREALLEQGRQVVTEDKARVAQITIEKAQADLIQKRLNEYDKLSEKGLARNTTTLELQLALANQQADVMRLEVDRSRLLINAKDIDIRLQTVEAAFKQQVLTDLNDVRQRLHDAEVTLPLAREQRLTRLRIAGTGAIPADAYIITVTRSDAEGRPVTTQVDGYTQIKPGDLIEVKPPRMDTDLPQAALPNQSQGQALGKNQGQRESNVREKRETSNRWNSYPVATGTR